MKKTIFITGTSSGVGFGLAKHYLDRGFHVYGISRKSNTELNGYENFNFLSQDLSQLGILPKVLSVYADSVKNLELVILNAGILNEIKDLKDTGIDEIKKAMDINVWSNKILIDTLFSCVENIEQVVAISSGAAVSGARGWNAYSLSKATLNMLISLYSKELTNTHFCALAPGLIDTQMQDYIFALPDEEKFPVVQKLKKAKGTEQMPDPIMASETIANAIEKSKKYPSGSFLDIRNL